MGNATLTRFYTLHFLLPIIIAAFLILHVILLHENGRNNPLGLGRDSDKIPFHSYYTVKDIVGFVFIFLLFGSVVLFIPFALGEPDNFIVANPLTTPAHIVPEWYFLFAYAILRCVPNKLGGVAAILISILILFTLPIYRKEIKRLTFSPGKAIYGVLVLSFFSLTFLGAIPVESPYNEISQSFAVAYFSYFTLGQYSLRQF